MVIYPLGIDCVWGSERYFLSYDQFWAHSILSLDLYLFWLFM